MYTEDDLLRFLKPYKRVNNASVCTQAVGQADVTFWVYDRGAWFKHDGDKARNHQSWCRAFFKTVLGLSQTEYEKAKKRLFAGEDLTGVYKSGNSYAVVYRPSQTLSRAHIAALVAGGLVAGGVGLAAKKKFQKQPTEATTTAHEALQKIDIEQLKKLYIELLPQLKNGGKIDQQKSKEFLDIVRKMVKHTATPEDDEWSKALLLMAVVLSPKMQEVDDILKETYTTITESEVVKADWGLWDDLANFLMKVEDFGRADKMLAASQFDSAKNVLDANEYILSNKYLESLVEDSINLEPDRARYYADALDELVRQIPDLQAIVGHLKVSYLIEKFTRDILSHQSIDELKFEEMTQILRTIQNSLFNSEPVEYQRINHDIRVISMFSGPDGLNIDRLQQLVNGRNFEGIVSTPLWSIIRDKSWLLSQLLQQGSVDQEELGKKLDAARRFHAARDELDEDSDHDLTELVKAVLKFEVPYTTALDELKNVAVEQGKDINATVDHIKQGISEDSAEQSDY